MSNRVINLSLEQLLVTWLSGLTWSSTISFYTGTGAGEPGNEPLMNLPRCVIAAPTGTNRIKETGIYDMDITVSIMHSADDTERSVHEEIGAEIIDTICSQTNIDSFNATVSAHIYNIFPASIATDQDERKWVTEMTLPTVAALGNVGA